MRSGRITNCTFALNGENTGDSNRITDTKPAQKCAILVSKAFFQTIVREAFFVTFLKKNRRTCL